MCIPEGYCNPNSITILDHSLGRTDLTHSGVEYQVLFQSDLCMPHSGQIWRGRIDLRSKIGVHLTTGPAQVLLPRDLHLGDANFEELKQGQEVEFEVLGARYQQGDTSIAVLAKLKNVIEDAKVKVEKATVEEPMLAAPVPGGGSSEQRQVVVVPQEPVMRKRRLNPKVASE